MSPQLYWCVSKEVSVGVICVAVVILAFAEEVSVRVIWVAAGVSSKRVLQECQVRVCRNKSVAQECQVRVSYKSVIAQCQARVSYKSVQ